MKNIFILMLACTSTAALTMEPEQQMNAPHQKTQAGASTRRDRYQELEYRAYYQPELRWYCTHPNAQYADGSTALHQLTKDYGGIREITKLLFAFGANQMIRDYAGNTPLIKAADNHFGRCCKLLVDIEASTIKTSKILALLTCLRRTNRTGVLYKEFKNLFLPHFKKAYCKPVVLLRIKNNEGKTAYDCWQLDFLNPDDEQIK